MLTSLARRLVLAGILVALALAAPTPAAAWVREAAPVQSGSIFQPQASTTVLPDGTVRYLAKGTDVGGDQTNRLVVRPPSGPTAFAAPFPAALGQAGGISGFLTLSSPDAAGNQLVVRGVSPFAVGFLSAASDTGAAAAEPTEQVTAIDLAPTGEAAAIVSQGSTAAVRFRPAGAAGRFDAPRELDRAGNQRSYAVGITLDPDGGVLVVYRTEQAQAMLQAYAPPGGDFGAPQPIDLPQSTLNLRAFRYGQSTNGHAVLAWDESTGGDTNSEVVRAVTRAPGGLLGTPQTVATARSGGLLSVSSAIATDDGSNYVAFLDAGPIVCPNNARGAGGVLAVGGATGWTALNEPTTGNERADIAALSSSGNAIGVLTQRSTSTDLCTDKDPVSALAVQLGQGANPGTPQTVASEDITGGSNATVVRPRGFAVNAAGAAVLLSDEPQSAANDALPFLYYQAAPAAPEPSPSPTPTQPYGVPTPSVPTPGPSDPPAQALPAPGKIRLSGKKLVARGGKIPLKASCTRLPQRGNTLYCSVAAILVERTKGRAGVVAKRPKRLAAARTVRVANGKSKRLTLKLNRRGKRKLRRSKRALNVTLVVTIRREGYAPNTIRRNLKLSPGKPKRQRKRG